MKTTENIKLNMKPRGIKINIGCKGRQNSIPYRMQGSASLYGQLIVSTANQVFNNNNNVANGGPAKAKT